MRARNKTESKPAQMYGRRKCKDIFFATPTENRFFSDEAVVVRKEAIFMMS